jgi:cytoskeleton protein RodZ
MPTIGEQLRTARARRGLELEQAEAATNIHLNQLEALESESFDEFPSKSYARSFLREYAEFLGLDPAPLLEELDSQVEEREPGPLMLVPAPRSRRSRWALLAVPMLAVAMVVFFWQTSSGNKPPSRTSARSIRSAQATRSTARSAAPRRAQPNRVVLVASAGRCWLSVHSGSRSGPLLYEGTLKQGEKAHFVRKQLWVRIGAPWDLSVLLGGRAASLPSSSVPINVVITRAGVRPA